MFVDLRGRRLASFTTISDAYYVFLQVAHRTPGKRALVSFRVFFVSNPALDHDFASSLLSLKKNLFFIVAIGRRVSRSCGGPTHREKRSQRQVCCRRCKT